jgi:hypothetical protein
MGQKLIEVTDAAGEKRSVRPVDAREIEAVATGEPVVVPAVTPEEGSIVEEVVDPVAFPKDFPGAAAFEKAGIGHHQTLRMTKDELLEVEGVGAGTADKILKLRGV